MVDLVSLLAVLKHKEPTPLTKAFQLGQTEVSQITYYMYTGKIPSKFDDRSCPSNSTYVTIDGKVLCYDLPVSNVSWNDTQTFFENINEDDETYTYQLPTEAQWEYAARSGTDTDLFFGNNELNILFLYANYSSVDPVSIASLRTNPNGLYHMYGNVAEFVKDVIYSYPESSSCVVDPIHIGDPYPKRKIVRGGGFNFRSNFINSVSRVSVSSTYTSRNIGFRMLRQVK